MKTQRNLFVLTFCLLFHGWVFGQQESLNEQENIVSALAKKVKGVQISPRKLLHKDSVDLESKIIPDYFLLGTFSDYGGRFAYIKRKTQVDRYYPYEEVLAKYVAGFIAEHYHIQVDLIFEESKHSEMFSQPMAEKLHSYYDETGKLKDDIFDTEEKMYSFLTGILLRNGENIFDNVFEISVANSLKVNEIYELLKALECDKIIYKNRRGSIPTVTKFYFEATPRIIQYFNLIKNENKIIRDAYKNVIYEIIEVSDEEKQHWEEQHKEFKNSIKRLFK